MKPRVLSLSALLSLAALTIMFAPGAAPRTAAQGRGTSGPNIGPLITPQSFDGSLTFISPAGSKSIQDHIVPLKVPANPSGPSAVTDRVVQSEVGAATIPKPGKTFAGLSFSTKCSGGGCGNGWPPDPNADVGPKNIIETVNTSIGIFTKTGTRQVGITFDKFWSVVSTGTPCNGFNQGDPIALYDALSDRWLVSDFAFKIDTLGNPVPPFYECIAVSKTGDPVNGGWWFYPILTDNVMFPDYPKFAVWPDAYYMTTNMFSGNSSAGVRVWVFDRSKMTSGAAVTPVAFDTSDVYSSLLVGNLRGALPPTGSPAYVASIDAPSTNTVHVWKLHYDPVTPGNSWFGQSSGNPNPVDIPVAAFVEPCNAAQILACVPEKGGSHLDYLDAIGDRMMYQLQYRNIKGTESLWATHTVADSSSQGSQTGIRWYQLDVTGGNISTTPVQQSTFKPNDGLFRWMPSLAVDKYGNMAVGFSVSGSSIYPGIRYAGRLRSDPLNTLAQGEAVLINGSGAQLSFGRITHIQRWGDYSSMTVDPTDDCTFWYTNEYYVATGGDWQTRIGAFKYSQCALNGKLLVDENAPGVQFDGWQNVADAGAGGASYHVTDTANDKVTFRFTGKSITWVYVSGPDEGNAQVKIDNVDKGTVSLFSASKQYNVSKTFGGLANRTHTITIQALGTGATDNKVVVDSFVVGSRATEDTANSIKYNTWTGSANSAARGGTYRYSQIKDATATFSFTGTAVDWVTVKGQSYGQAEVFIDNFDRGRFELYSATTKYKAPITFSGLAPGTHTIKIEVLHTKKAVATGFRVAVDAFLVTP